jgi:putative ABC transport system permease protein
MVMAVAVAVGLGVVLGNTNASIVEGSSLVAGRDDAELFVSTLGPNNSLGIEAKVSPTVLAALRKVPGVAAVHEHHGFCGKHPAVGPFCVSSHYGRGTEFTIFRGRSSVKEVFDHGEVLIGPALARSKGLRPGDTFDFPGRTGMHTLKVGAIWADPDNTGSSLTVAVADFPEMFGEHPPASLSLEPEPGVSLDELDRRVEAAALDPDLMSRNSEEFADDLEKSIGSFVTPFAALQRAMLVVALVAVTSTLLLVGVQRRREHGTLLAVGMAPGGLARMVLSEAGLVGLTGAVLGTIAGIVSFVAMIWVSALVTGLEAPFRFDLVAPLVYGVGSSLLVLVAAAFPAWRTSRIEPAVALRYE